MIGTTEIKRWSFSSVSRRNLVKQASVVHVRKLSEPKLRVSRRLYPTRRVFAIAKDKDERIADFRARSKDKREQSAAKVVVEDLERYEEPKDTCQRHLRKAYLFHPQFTFDARTQLRQEYVRGLNRQNFRDRIKTARYRFLYNYYNWRKDAWNDLIIFTLFNICFVFLGGLLKAALTEALTGQPVTDLEIWQYIYQVNVLMFGNSFPDKAASFLDQSYSLIVAGVGLGGFALSLALVEQVVLENLDANVKQGSQVYETDHLVILIWGKSQRDLEVAQRIMEQAAWANKQQGGKAIVILCHREKLELEDFYRKAIPEEERYGSRFVFRQGSPLDASDLESVAASKAEAVIIVSDSSRSPEEADAQVVRSAILLDELGYPGPGQQDYRDAVVIAEIRTVDALPLIQFACSPRVIAFPTNINNARSLCRLVGHPVLAMLGQVIWDFKTHCTADIRNYPQMTGKTFGELHFYFPEATIAGIVQDGYGSCLLNPRHDTVIGPYDDIISLRPVVGDGNFDILEDPVYVTTGDWTPNLACLSCGNDDETCFTRYSTALIDRSADSSLEEDEFTIVVGSIDALIRNENGGPQGLLLHDSREDPVMGLLIVGWAEPTFMSDLLRELDHGPTRLPYGSLITLFNEHAKTEVTSHLNDINIRNLAVRHVPGNPFSVADLRRKIDVSLYNNAMVLCDIRWLDPDDKITNGIEVHNQEDMMRIDAQIMMVQLNIRKLLQERDLPEINIICEKLSVAGGQTRFEDEVRQPLGVCVKFTSYSAELLMQVAHNPQVMFPLFTWGAGDGFLVQDVSLLAAPNEKLSYWDLMARAQRLQQILVGYCEIPPPNQPNKTVEVVLNPQGMARRSRKRVWNYNQGRVKLICIAHVPETEAVAREAAQVNLGQTSFAAMDRQVRRWAKYKLSTAGSLKEEEDVSLNEIYGAVLTDRELSAKQHSDSGASPGSTP